MIGYVVMFSQMAQGTSRKGLALPVPGSELWAVRCPAAQDGLLTRLGRQIVHADLGIRAGLGPLDLWTLETCGRDSRPQKVQTWWVFFSAGWFFSNVNFRESSDTVLLRLSGKGAS